MKKLNKKQAIIIMGYTGIKTCAFNLLHEDVERRIRRPVFTHEFPMLKDEIKNLYKDDFLDICYKGASQ
jgi:hypothetical protein